jgi:hypothetical protein
MWSNGEQRGLGGVVGREVPASAHRSLRASVEVLGEVEQPLARRRQAAALDEVPLHRDVRRDGQTVDERLRVGRLAEEAERDREPPARVGPSAIEAQRIVRARRGRAGGRATAA